MERLDSDTNETDKLRAILDEELEECDEDGNSEVHHFKMSCSAIEQLGIFKEWTSLLPSSSLIKLLFQAGSKFICPVGIDVYRSNFESIKILGEIRRPENKFYICFKDAI